MFMFKRNSANWLKIMVSTLALSLGGCGLKGPLYQTPEPVSAPQNNENQQAAKQQEN
jgi:predicted small lipoprotein YifL